MRCYFCKSPLDANSTNTSNTSFIKCDKCNTYHSYNGYSTLIMSNIFYKKYHIVLNFIDYTTSIFNRESLIKSLICKVPGHPINLDNIEDKLKIYLMFI